MEHLQKLRRLCLELTGKEPWCDVTCSDEISRRISFDELCDFENAPSARITDLALMAEEHEGVGGFQFDIGARIGSPCHFEIHGYEHQVVTANAEMHKILEGMQTWYVVLQRAAKTLIQAFVFAVAIPIVLLLYNWIGLVDLSEFGSEKRLQPTPVIFVVVGLISAPIVAPRIRKFLRDLYVPPVSFAIGQGVERFHFAEHIRRGTAGVLISSLIAVLATWALR